MAPNSTIVAIATPTGRGGIGLVRLSGPDAIAIGRRIFRSDAVLGERPRRVQFGRVLDAAGEEVDTALAWVLAGPSSYTGEDTVEISTHGSAVVLESLVEAAMAGGAVMAQPGEFTRRAFMHGNIDLVQAEAVVDLIQCESRGSIASAYAAASGRLSGEVRRIQEQLVKALSWMELGLDFSEEDLEPVERRRTQKMLRDAALGIQTLTATFESARRRQEGFRLVLMGRPNAGKSTLLNALAGEDRAIVASTPGTTRDLVEGRVVWRGESVRLIDTAGIREESDPVEREGMARTWRAAAESDCAVVVMDTSSPWDEEDGALMSRLNGIRAIVALNKCDLCTKLRLPPEILKQRRALAVSALDGTGLDELREAAAETMFSDATDLSAGLLRQRHHDLLVRAHAAIDDSIEAEGEGLPECASAALKNSLQALGEILGENVEEAVLDEIFAEFCIGK